MIKYTNWSLLFLRMVTGTGFIVHGWAKISRGVHGFEKLLMQEAVPFPHLMSYVAPYTELFGGIALLFGLWTRWVSVPLIITMLVAMFTVNIHYGFSSINTIGLTPQGPVFGPPGYEINLLYIAILISFIIHGGGRFSIDEISKKKNKENAKR